jgi:TPR repeat protein
VREALAQFNKAAEQGYAPAQNSVGVAYETGRGVVKDELEAVAWYRKAAQQGFSLAQRNLGAMYSKDKTEAAAWYRKAAEQGDKDAKIKLAELTAELSAPKPDPVDVVAQVLNYSNFGKDEVIEAMYWYQDNSDRCRYKLFQKNALSQPREIDLNALDPRTTTFGNGIDILGLPSIIIRDDVSALFTSPGSLNIERLQRGWSLIYSKYCFS